MRNADWMSEVHTPSRLAANGMLKKQTVRAEYIQPLHGWNPEGVCNIAKWEVRSADFVLFL